MRPSGIENRFRFPHLAVQVGLLDSWGSAVVHNCRHGAVQTKISMKIRDILQADLSSPDDADCYASTINP